MKLKLTDKERLAKFKCQTKDCPNKAGALFKTRYLCERCNRRINPKPSDRRCYYVNYIPQRR